MASEVKLTFIGDADSLEKAAQRAGSATEDMASKVNGASKTVSDSGAGFDKAAEGFDKAEQKAMGFRDTLTGVQDGMKGVGGLLKGDFSAQNFMTLGAGVGDLASGFSNFLIPSLKNAVTWFKTTKVAMLAQAAVSKVVTAGQWLLNVAMSANPIGLIIIAIVALVAIFILLWTKSEAFRNFFIGMWNMIKDAAKAVADWFSGPFVDFFVNAWNWIVEKGLAVLDWFKSLPGKIWEGIKNLFNILTTPHRLAIEWIIDKGKMVLQWFKDLPGKIGGFLSGIKNTIISAFKSAFNWVNDQFNKLIGGINTGIRTFNKLPGPDIPEIPKLPTFHNGGVVPGLPGQEVLAVLQAGERVIPRSGANGGAVVLQVNANDSETARFVATLLQRYVSSNGGNVQIALGR